MSAPGSSPASRPACSPEFSPESPPESPVVRLVVPVYDNATTIEEVLRGVAASGIPVVVVNDGSTDGSDAIARRLVGEGVVERVLDCPRNLGKAAALRLAFAALRADGVDVAISVDADGQHDPTLVGRFAPASPAEADRLVVGCRWPLHPHQPRRNLLGRFVSNVAIRAQAGVTVGDAPCGFRAWPLRATVATPGRSGRYAWEQEMITRLAWRGVPLASVDVPAIYHPPDRRVSHYRFGRDWPEGLAIYGWLLLVALVPLPWGGAVGTWRSLVRRFDRLLSPGRLRGPRPEAATTRAFTMIAMTLGLLAGATLPTSFATAAATAWIGWRWHAGFGAIALAAGPSMLDAGLTIDPSWLQLAAIAWLLGGVIRPAR